MDAVWFHKTITPLMSGRREPFLAGGFPETLENAVGSIREPYSQHPNSIYMS